MNLWQGTPEGAEEIRNESMRKLHMPFGDHHSYIRSAGGDLFVQGVQSVLPAGTADTVGMRVRRFFQDCTQGPRLLFGAMPFDRRQTDFLIQPRAVAGEPPASIHASMPASYRATPAHWQVTAQPSAAQYRAMVARALEKMHASGGESAAVNKVVLARRLMIEADLPLDPHGLAARLAQDPSVTTFVVPLPPAALGQTRRLVGGTPELLVAKKGRDLRSNPLAGSAKRQTDASADRAVSEALVRSEKNRREHLAVVEAILDTLAPHCEQLRTPDICALQATASMWHLGTRIEGRLRDAEWSSAELAALLHPTPAVCGSPRKAAQALIHELEPFDRGFYAGAVGWTDASGDGEWYVSLRCGEVCGRQILLYAGAGIVAGSDPAAEVAETSAKFLALLQALGIDEQGKTMQEQST